MADRRGRFWTRILGAGISLAIILVVAAAAFVYLRLSDSRAKLDGTLQVAGLHAPVTIVRDAAGIPTVRGEDRRDLAFALGYLHAQERFFEMDQLRRAAAGELSALFGGSTAALDRKLRLHRFRARAQATLQVMTAAEHRVLDAYSAGVNRGLGDLKAKPFEYLILNAKPQAWAAEDSLLVGYAMYLDLQGASPEDELERARAEARGGRALAAFLYPETSELDAPVDGSTLPEPPLPGAPPPAPPAAPAEGAAELAIPGSNNWAVSGALTTTGAALVSNDMHLANRIPNIWYRAHLIQTGPDAFETIGVTLPGAPMVIAGSNTHIAWGFTNSYIDTHDAVILETAPGQPDSYMTPSGAKPLTKVSERLCVKAKCSDLIVEETIWGPVVDRLPDGRRVVERWTAHDPGAVGFATFLALEHAADVPAAIAIAHTGAVPQQNFTVGDSAGHIGWTIIGRVPQRFGEGFDSRWASSWADGKRGWSGYLAADQVPVVIDPPGGRIWTANARVVGGEAYRKLGDGGYDNGARAARIRDRLMAQTRFTPADMLSIQLDDQSDRGKFWRDDLLRLLGGPASRDALAEPVRGWNGRADAASVGYRLIAAFRTETINRIYAAYVGAPDAAAGRQSYAPAQGEGPVRRLLRARPANLIPPGFQSWDAVEAKALAAVRDQVTAAGGLGRFSWGAKNVAGVHHPLAAAIPFLGRLTDPRDAPQSGDSGVPLAKTPGFGPSERFAVSPGHEAEALMHMPGGQAGDPLSPYYLAGHADWLYGRPAPFLPGPAKWTLTLRP